MQQNLAYSWKVTPFSFPCGLEQPKVTHEAIFKLITPVNFDWFIQTASSTGDSFLKERPN